MADTTVSTIEVCIYCTMSVRRGVLCLEEPAYVRIQSINQSINQSIKTTAEMVYLILLQLLVERYAYVLSVCVMRNGCWKASSQNPVVTIDTSTRRRKSLDIARLLILLQWFKKRPCLSCHQEGEDKWAGSWNWLPSTVELQPVPS